MVTDTANTPQSRPSNTKRLTPAQRTAIVAQVASGQTNIAVAQQFGVHVNSVSRLVSAVRQQVKDTVLDRESRQAPQVKALAQVISDDAKLAIHASVQDRDDVHKAAGTGLSWLKGTGELAGDNQVNVFIGALREMPADVRDEYLSIDATDATATVVTPQDVDSSR